MVKTLQQRYFAPLNMTFTPKKTLRFAQSDKAGDCLLISTSFRKLPVVKAAQENDRMFLH